MKPATLPILPLAAFPPAEATGPASHRPYYVQQLETHAARFPGVSAPHTHDFYLLLYITRGSGTHTIDLQDYELRPGALFFLAPGQVHSWKLSADATGYIVFFEAGFYQQHYPASRLHGYPFFDPNQLPVVYLPLAHNPTELLLSQLWAEAMPRANPSDEVVAAYLFLVLELAARGYAVAPGSAAALGRQQLRRFSQLLNQHFRQQKTVAFYANELHMSPNHLTAVCQRLVGHPARDLILARVMAEAQRRLHHSADSVAQLAEALGYADASYFNRVFKKHVGMTPESFRRQR